MPHILLHIMMKRFVTLIVIFLFAISPMEAQEKKASLFKAIKNTYSIYQKSPAIVLNVSECKKYNSEIAPDTADTNIKKYIMWETVVKRHYTRLDTLKKKDKKLYIKAIKLAQESMKEIRLKNPQDSIVISEWEKQTINR